MLLSRRIGKMKRLGRAVSQSRSELGLGDENRPPRVVVLEGLILRRERPPLAQSAAVVADQHDPPHWPAADTLDAGEQLHHPRAAAAAVVPHALDDVADQHFAVRQGPGDQPLLLAAAIAHDPQEPRRERAQRLAQRFRARRQRVGSTPRAPLTGPASRAAPCAGPSTRPPKATRPGPAPAVTAPRRSRPRSGARSRPPPKPARMPCWP
jgi:hypothetical protein